jgi:hypothetical protein
MRGPPAACLFPFSLHSECGVPGELYFALHQVATKVPTRI